MIIAQAILDTLQISILMPISSVQTAVAWHEPKSQPPLDPGSSIRCCACLKQTFGALQDLEAVKSVQQQLDGFRQEMERDGRAQRNEARKLVLAAIKRAQKLVDSTLQVVGPS